MTKKEILEKLKKTYKRATDRIFSEDCHIFNDHDFTCQLTLNFDKTLTITVKAELCSTDAQSSSPMKTLNNPHLLFLKSMVSTLTPLSKPWLITSLSIKTAISKTSTGTISKSS